jgi:hypothetical protein
VASRAWSRRLGLALGWLTVLRPYGLSEANAVHALRSLRSLVHGFTTLELAGAFVLPLDLDESFQQIVLLFLVLVIVIAAGAGVLLARSET